MSPSPSAPRVAYVTGADAPYFDQILLLLGSLRRHSPSTHLMVCDFGLEAPQREFLRRQNRLLPIPEDLPPARHPWDYKASVGRFVAPLGVDAVLWLDTDLVVMADLPAHVPELLRALDDNRAELAVTGAGTLEEQRRIDPAPHYAALSAGLDPALPYLNSGFFLCRSFEMLEAWRRQTLEMPLEMLFEQNAFNLVAFRRGRLLLLDPWVWNLANTGLETMRPTAEGVEDRNGPVGVLHLTSSDRARHLCQWEGAYGSGGLLYRGRFRMLQRPDVRAAHEAMIAEAVTACWDDLIAAGLTRAEA